MITTPFPPFLFWIKLQVCYWRDLWLVLPGILEILILVSPAHAAKAHTFVVCDKSMQKHAFAHRAESTHNHRQGLYKLIFILLFLLTFSAIFSWCLSVIMRFLLSASRALFSALLYLKWLSSIVTATFCYCHALYISHCFPLPFTTYSLP